MSEEFHADEFRHFQFPRRPHHHVDGISAADADGRHAQSARIGRMGVRSHHHAAREGIVFEHHLMDDARAGGPEAHAETLGSRLQEGIDLSIGLPRRRQVVGRAALRPDEVVAMNSARHRRLRLPSVHKLEDGHLGRGVLHTHAVGMIERIVHAAPMVISLFLRLFVCQQHFLGIRERTGEQCPHPPHFLLIACVEFLNLLNVVYHNVVSLLLKALKAKIRHYVNNQLKLLTFSLNLPHYYIFYLCLVGKMAVSSESH